MIRIAIVGAVLLVAVIASLLLRRRAPQAPSGSGSSLPMQVDRSDFDKPNHEWLVVAFTSATCNTCADIQRKVSVLATKSVAVHIAEFSEQRAVHEKYAIDAVPAVLMVDMQGVVHASFLGPVSATDLWAALARARDGLAQKTAEEHCH
jgi:hypothetical protein